LRRPPCFLSGYSHFHFPLHFHFPFTLTFTRPPTFPFTLTFTRPPPFTFTFTFTPPMPTYVYETIPQKSRQKPHRFEIKQSMMDAALTRHPDTGTCAARDRGRHRRDHAARCRPRRSGGGCGCGALRVRWPSLSSAIGSNAATDVRRLEPSEGTPTASSPGLLRANSRFLHLATVCRAAANRGYSSSYFSARPRAFSTGYFRALPPSWPRWRWPDRCRSRWRIPAHRSPRPPILPRFSHVWPDRARRPATARAWTREMLHQLRRLGRERHAEIFRGVELLPIPFPGKGSDAAFQFGQRGGGIGGRHGGKEV